MRKQQEQPLTCAQMDATNSKCKFSPWNCSHSIGRSAYKALNSINLLGIRCVCTRPHSDLFLLLVFIRDEACTAIRIQAKLAIPNWYISSNVPIKDRPVPSVPHFLLMLSVFVPFSRIFFYWYVCYCSHSVNNNVVLNYKLCIVWIWLPGPPGAASCCWFNVAAYT